ncbi:MAG TPA: NAD(P)H-hydrate dehydratase [Candidatus Deferrimicrobium sp.]|nr:NAD(P)H-hydrate dehydratase [Candidatus Deferrimicrobium sp.]
MKLVTAEQMRRIDRETIEGGHVSGPQLMENAGRGIAERLLKDVIDVSADEKVTIFCGKGNNGGDGFVIGRYLMQAGVDVTAWFIGPLDELSGDPRLNFDRAAGIGMKIVAVTAPEHLPEKLNRGYIIDAIFGTGFSGAPHGVAADMIEYINRCHDHTVISVDLPSGLDADTGQHEGVVVKADFTYSLAFPKYGLYVSPGRELAGHVEVVPIGVPDAVVDRLGLSIELVSAERVATLLPERKPDGHKGDFGKVFILAGSTGLTGAAAMSAKSALRCGCGLAKVGCPASVLPTIASLAMEATSHPLPDVAKKGALALRGLGEVRKLASEHDAVIVGPGLGQHHETKELVRRFIGKLDRPAIIDADGLNALVDHTDVLKTASSPTVLTPHPGEFQRLTSMAVPPERSIHERINVAVQAARDLKCVMVLKGSPTLIAEPNGACYLNPTGNNGMATGGSGDVLSGAIGSFLAQGMSPLNAAICAVYIHGLAGDLAAADLTPRAMIAGDMIDYLPEAFVMLE